MKQLPEVLDLSITLRPPAHGAPSNIIATTTLSCDALGLAHTGDLLPALLSNKERKSLRWYLEEYWKWPYLEFAERGRQVEALLQDVGKRLYHVVFGSVEAQSIVQEWQQHSAVRHQLSIISDLPAVLSLPWELLHDAVDFLALRPEQPISVVRRLQPEQTATPSFFEPPLRVLLITSRPVELGFIDPRSIARELLDELQTQIEVGAVELEFLRPPTLAALKARLSDSDRPHVHILHFDGHGAFDEETGGQGVLLFETDAGRSSPVEASNMAKVLSNSAVRLVTLTACQSAMSRADDAFSSVAAQLMKSGADAVIAMSAKILVASTLRYVEALYRELAAGTSAPLAHERARQALHADPRRHVHRRRGYEEGDPVELQDWWLPHFYQQRLLELRPTKPPGQLSPSNAQMHLSNSFPTEPRYGFTGRARELLQLERWLRLGKIVVIYGFGGIGKTALVCEAADWLTRTTMYDGACFVSFEHAGDARWLLSVLGAFLGVYDGHYNPNDRESALARLRPILQERRTLVIADNLEGALPAKNAVPDSATRRQLWDTLLDLSAIGAGILLTSRGADFAVERPVQGKQVAYLRLGGLYSDDAYILALRLLTDLQIDRKNVPYAELLDLLERLDHHPLAIQLVLSRLKEVSLSQLKTEFVALLPKFVDDRETGRSRSLLASLEYSLHRLTQEQQALLLRLAVFEGRAFELDLLTITDISTEEWGLLRPALEQAALLTDERVYQGTDLHFLRFHPVLTPYLRSLVDLNGADHTGLRMRYCQHYHFLVHLLINEVASNPQINVWIRWELPNLLHAVDLLFEAGKPGAASDLSSIIIHFLDTLGLVRERDELKRRVAEATASSKASELQDLGRAEWKLQISQGAEEYTTGKFDVAADRLEALVTRIEASSEGAPLDAGSLEHAMVLRQLGSNLREGGQLTAAWDRLEQALAINLALLERAPEDREVVRELSRLMIQIGVLLSYQGRYKEAKDAYQTVINSEMLTDDPQTLDLEICSEVLIQLGTLEVRQGEYQEAKTRLTVALKYLRLLREPELQRETNVWRLLGIVAQKQKNWTEAEQCYRKSLEIAESLGNELEAAMTCNQLAGLAEDLGRITEAEGWYKRAVGFAERVSPNPFYVTFLSNLAKLLLRRMPIDQDATTRLAEARSYAERARVIRDALGMEPDGQLQRMIESVAARTYREDGALTVEEYHRESTLSDSEYEERNLEAASRRLIKLLTRIEAIPEGMPLGKESFEHCVTLSRLARCLDASGQPIIAEKRLQEALTIIDKLIAQRPEHQGRIRQRGIILAEMGDVRLSQGQYSQVLELYTEALRIAEQQGNQWDKAVALAGLGRLALAQQDYIKAKLHYTSALDLFRTLGSLTDEAIMWHQLGRIAQEQKEWAEAEHCLRGCLALEEQQGNKALAATTYNGLALIAMEMGRATVAKEWFQRGLELDEEVQPGIPIHVAHLSNLARLLVREVQAGRTPVASLFEARGYAERAMSIDQAHDLSATSWTPYGILADIAELEGQMDAAREYRRREHETCAAFPGNRSRTDQEFGQFIKIIAAATYGDAQAREMAELILSQFGTDALSRYLVAAIHCIWSGERDWHALTEALNGPAALIVLRILETALPLKRDTPNVTESSQETEELLQAIARLDQAIELNPAEASIYVKRGFAYARLGELRRAVADWSQAIELAPSEAPLYFYRGTAYLELKEYEQAIADYDRALALAPDEHALYAKRAVAYYSLKKYQQAIKDYDRALALKSENAESHFNRGLAHYCLAEYEQAIADYDRAIALDPDRTEAYFNRGAVYCILGEYQRAIEDWDRAIDLDANDPAAYHNRGLAHAKLSAYPQAIEDYSRALALDPTDASTYFYRGQAYMNLGEYQQAVHNYEQAGILGLMDVETYFMLGVAYYNMGAYEQAIANWKRAIDLNPDDALIYSNCGIAYAHLGEYEQALSSHNRAIELDPDNADFYYNRARVYAHLGQFQRAIEDFNRVIDLDPTNADRYIDRAYLYLHLNNVEQARADFAQATEIDTMNVNAAWMVVYTALGRLSPSIEVAERLETIATIDPTQDKSHLCLAVAFSLRMNLKEALAELEQSMLLNPQSQEAFLWKGVLTAQLNQDQDDAAVGYIEEALDLGLPPVLLTPLYWLEKDRPDFYIQCARSILARYNI